MATLKAGAGSLVDVSQWGWLGMDAWPTAGKMTMRCYGGTAGEKWETSADFTLSAAPDFKLTWAVGQFGQYCSGRSVSTTDQDNDAWTAGNAVTNSNPASHWPYEGQGWGWHNSAHACSLWDRTGTPICFGMSPACWSGGQKCKADRVELYMKIPDLGELVARAVPISQFAKEAQVDLATLKAGSGSLSDDDKWGWLGMEKWPTSGTLTMACYGGVAGSGWLSSKTFTLSSGPDFKLTWAVGQFGDHCSGRSISTTDQDNDAWTAGNAVTNSNPASHWPYEGQGWGWHNNAHACSLWDRTGTPICFGMSPQCWSGGQKCKADRVELWVE